jgi:hypothetical protein
MVTVTETLPAGLTLVAMTGTGWTCASNVCTRSDALAAGASYPAITVTVNVAVNETFTEVELLPASFSHPCSSWILGLRNRGAADDGSARRWLPTCPSVCGSCSATGALAKPVRGGG